MQNAHKSNRSRQVRKNRQILFIKINNIKEKVPSELHKN